MTMSDYQPRLPLFALLPYVAAQLAGEWPRTAWTMALLNGAGGQPRRKR